MATTKILLVMRHAKSSWANRGTPDKERPLNKRGFRDAPAMAKFLVAQGITIDRIVSSTAVRAHTTAMKVIEATNELTEKQLELRDEFYHAPAYEYLNYLGSFADDSVSTLMLVGHNPGLEELIESLTDDWETMPTAAIACFEVAIDSWHEFSVAKTRLIDVWRPKEVLTN